MIMNGRPLLWILLLLGTGCASTKTLSSAPIPFHVGIIPPTTRVLRSDAGTDEDADYLVVLDQDSLSQGMIRALQEGGCTRASMLQPPSSLDGVQLADMAPEDRDRHWIEECKRLGVDLLIEPELSYSPRIQRKRNDRFWLNLPLFLLGGPGCYFVDDLSYLGQARIRAGVYDLHAILAERASLADGRSKLTQLETRFEELSFDFMDRNGLRLSTLAASVLIPAGLLPDDRERVTLLLAERMQNALVRGLAQEMQAASQELILAERVASFYMEPGTSVQKEGRRVRLRGGVILERGEIERMESWNVRAGSRVASGTFSGGTSDDDLSTNRQRFLRYDLDLAMDVDADAEELEVELAGVGRERSIRTFSFSLR
jgi:hypothetical protein